MHPIVSWLSQRFIRTGGLKTQKTRIISPLAAVCAHRGRPSGAVGARRSARAPAWAGTAVRQALLRQALLRQALLRQALAAEELVDVVDCPGA